MSNQQSEHISDGVLVSVCICTFRRESLFETLESIANQKLAPALRVEVIVADNDEKATRRVSIERKGLELGMRLRYVHAPKQNISLARNACLDAAAGALIAFIDDDETASFCWLQNLYDAAEQRKLDIVFGPVLARYPATAPKWMAEADCHSIIPDSRRPLITGHTSNALVNRAHPAVLNHRFDLRRGRSGGEDTQFFYECFQSGATLGYEPEAVTFEPVTEKRLNLDWIRKSKFRSGVTYGKAIVYRSHLPKDLMHLCLALMKVVYCVGMASLSLHSRAKRTRHYVRAVFHAGIIGAFFGAAEKEYYGAVDATNDQAV